MLNLHTLMRCLHALTTSLPKSPLGKQVCVCVVLHDGVKTYRIADTIDTEIQSQYKLFLSHFSLHKHCHFV